MSVWCLTDASLYAKPSYGQDSKSWHSLLFSHAPASPKGLGSSVL